MKTAYELLLKTIWIGIAVLQAVRVYMSNNLAIVGQEVYKLDVQIERLREENEKLRYEVAKETSLTKIRDEALQMGFQHPTASDVIFFYDD